MQHEFINLLIQSSRRGRKTAFIELFELNVKKIYTFCIRLLADEKLADQISMEIFTEAWRNIRFVRDDTRFDTWLKGIGIFIILDEIRTRSRTEKIYQSIEIPESKVIVSSNKLESTIISLPEKDRILFVLRHIEGYSYDEISDFIHDISREEIKKSIVNTRQKLCAMMKDEL